MNSALIFIIFLVLIVVFVALERARQQRRLGSSKSEGTALMRTGMLELQSMLEPDRKIEMLVREDEATVQEETGAPPTPPRPRSDS